jgi:hypothetical protein
MLCDGAKRNELSVPLPQTGRQSIDAIRIRGENGAVFEASDCRGCSVCAELLLSAHNARSFTLDIFLA